MKARGDSKLKTLPPEKQKEIVSWLDSMTQEETIKRVRKEFGVLVSSSCLSRFYQWFHLSRTLEEAASFADRLREDLKRIPGLDLDDSKLSAAAQVAFELQALKTQDARLFVGLRRLRQNRDALALEREKFQFDASSAALSHAAELKTIAADSSMTPRQKLDQARRRLFGSTPE